MAKVGDMKRLAELKDELREPKARLMRTLAAMETIDRRLASRLGTIIGRIEDLQRRLPG
jgi:primosomal protein N''